jgi:hypothetical protein
MVLNTTIVCSLGQREYKASKGRAGIALAQDVSVSTGARYSSSSTIKPLSIFTVVHPDTDSETPNRRRMNGRIMLALCEKVIEVQTCRWSSEKRAEHGKVV